MADITVNEFFVDPDYYGENISPTYTFGGSGGGSVSAGINWAGSTLNAVGTFQDANTIVAQEYLTFNGTGLFVGEATAAYGGGAYSATIGSTTLGEYGELELVGNRTGANERAGQISWRNVASSNANKLIGAIYVEREDDDDDGQFHLDLTDDGANSRSVYRANTSFHNWYVTGTDELRLDAAYLRPSTDQGLSLGSYDQRWLKLWTMDARIVNLAGTGTRMVTADTNGDLGVEDFILEIPSAGANDGDILVYGGSSGLWTPQAQSGVYWDQNSAGQIIPATPGDDVLFAVTNERIMFGDADTYMYEISDDVFHVVVGDLQTLRLEAGTSVQIGPGISHPDAGDHRFNVLYGHINMTTIDPIASAPTAALAGVGAGNVDDGTHYYYVKFVTAYGTTGYDNTTESNQITVVDKSTDGQVDLTGIPTGAAELQVTARKLYRTQAGARYTAYYLTTISDNVTTTYRDNTADSGLDTSDVWYRSPDTTGGQLHIDGSMIASADLYNTYFGKTTKISTGGGNTVFGSSAGGSMTSAASNTFVGASAGDAITTGGANVFIGNQAGRDAAVSTGGAIYIGSAAGQDTTGDGNTAVGQVAGRYAGSYNTALGRYAGRYHEGDGNVFIGYGAGESTSITHGTGNNNTVVGYDAGDVLTTGTSNVFLGSYTGDAVTSGSQNLLLGYAVDASAADVTYEFRLGISTTILLEGDMTLGSQWIGSTYESRFDEINEYTGAAGVTIEGVLIKDSDITIPAATTGYLYFGSAAFYIASDGASWFEMRSTDADADVIISSNDEVRLNADRDDSSDASGSVNLQIASITGASLLNDGNFRVNNTLEIGDANQYITTDSAGNMVFTDNVLSASKTLSELAQEGPGVSFGSNNEIPTTNATTDDFDYSANFTYDGTSVYITGGSNPLRIRRPANTTSWGTGIYYELYNSINAYHTYAYLAGQIIDNTSTSEEGALLFYVSDAGTVLSKMQLTSDYLSVYNILRVDEITEYTGSAGVTIEGVLLEDSGITLGTGATVDTIETAITNDDTHLPTSGAVVDYVASEAYSLGLNNEIPHMNSGGTDFEYDADFVWSGTYLTTGNTSIGPYVRVGIPSNKGAVYLTSDVGNEILSTLYTNTASLSNKYYSWRYGGTLASSAAAPTDAVVSTDSYSVYDGTSLVLAGTIVFQVDGAIATGDFDTKIIWNLKEGAASNAEKMSLDSVGLEIQEGLEVGGAAMYFTALASDDTEDHVIAIDDSTGLLSKRSVASIGGTSISFGNEYEIPFVKSDSSAATDDFAYSSNFAYVSAGETTTLTLDGGSLLDITGESITMGGDASDWTARTDSTSKNALIKGIHYDTDEEDIVMLRYSSLSSLTAVQLGGGNASYNAATSVAFYCASDTTTLGGTIVGAFTSVGLETDIIDELNSGNGVTIEDILLKDGQISLDGTDSNPGIYITYDSAGNMVFADQVVSASQTLSDLLTGTGSGYWSRTGTDLSPNTSGDDILLASTELIKFVDSNSYIYGSASNNIDVYISSSQAFKFGSSAVTTYSPLVANNNETLGSASAFWGATYVQRLYIDATSNYIDVSSGDMIFTDGSNTDVTLSSLVSGSDAWDRSSAGEISPATAGDDILLAVSTEHIKFGDGDTYIYENGDDTLSFYTNSYHTMYLQSNGTTGTAVMYANLNLQQAASNHCYLYIEAGTANYDSYIQFVNTSTTEAIAGWDDSSSIFQIHTGTGFVGTTSGDFSINSSGNVFMAGLTNTTSGNYIYYDSTSKQLTYNTTSDIRLKNVLERWEPDSLEFLVKQDILRFDWKDGSGNNQIGWNANQMSELMPELTWQDEDGYWNYYDAHMRFHFHRAIKQLNDITDCSVDEINFLKDEIHRLRKQIEVLTNKFK